MQDKVHPSVAKDYYRVIPKSEAVTFKGILTKLDRWQYSSLQEFQADILSVDRNCRKYNSYGGGQFGNPSKTYPAPFPPAPACNFYTVSV